MHLKSGAGSSRRSGSRGSGGSRASGASRTGRQFDSGDRLERALEGELDVTSSPPARTLDLEPDCVAWTKRDGRGELGRQTARSLAKLAHTYGHEFLSMLARCESQDR